MSGHEGRPSISSTSRQESVNGGAMLYSFLVSTYAEETA